MEDLRAITDELEALLDLPLTSQADLRTWLQAAEAFGARLQSQRIDELPHELWHYLADADIRRRDHHYRRAQEDAMRALIAQLRGQHAR